MNRYLTTSLLILLIMLISVAPLSSVLAAPAMSAPAGLSLLEIKVTGSEYLLLQNNSSNDISDLSSYWLTVYNNVNPLAAGVYSSSQQLPVSSLKIGQTLLLSSDGGATCGASVTAKLSLSLTDGSGFLQLSQNTVSASGAIMQSASDLVSWSSGNNAIIQSVPSSTKAPRGAYYRYMKNGGFAWQQADVDATNSCQLNIVVAGDPGSSSAVTPLNLVATSPPATILGDNAVSSIAATTGQIPDSDTGLSAPQLSELLPNPVGSGNDATDEYIELYNPNDKPFDLTGFVLVSGSVTSHRYIFPAGSMLAATSFSAFYASQTKLSMSNTSGQVSLFDPLGNIIGTTAMYQNAKDGYAWALAQGTWYVTTRPTPGAANIIVRPAVKTTSRKASKASKSAAAASKKHKTKKHSLGSSTTSASSFQDPSSGAHVHSWVLASIGGAALLYGAYEYRRDLANRMYWLGTKLGLRRGSRKKSTGPGSD